MGYERIAACIVVGAGSLMLIFQEQYQFAVPLLTGLLAFFIGEANGARKTA